MQEIARQTKEWNMNATLRWMQQAQPENHPSRAHPAPLAFTHHPLL